MLGETTLCFHLDVLYREEKFKVVWVAKHDFRWARKLANIVKPFCSRWVNLDPRSSVSPQRTQRNAEESGTKGFRHFLAQAVPPPKDRTEIAFSQNSLAVRGRILRDTVLQQIFGQFTGGVRNSHVGCPHRCFLLLFFPVLLLLYNRDLLLLLHLLHDVPGGALL